MKIQKFGTIRFTERGLPVFENFNFIPESEEEEAALRKSNALYLSKVFEIVIKHMSDVYNRHYKTFDDMIEKEFKFDEPIGKHAQSPEQVVNAFLTKVSKP